MPEFRFLPVSLERSIGPTMMDPGQARILQHVDVTWLDGWLRRGKGCVRTKVTPNANTVTGAVIAERRDGRRIVVDSDNGGVIRATVGDGVAGCASSLVESDDRTEFPTVPTFCENFNEECPSVPDPTPFGY